MSCDLAAIEPSAIRFALGPGCNSVDTLTSTDLTSRVRMTPPIRCWVGGGGLTQPGISCAGHHHQPTERLLLARLLQPVRWLPIPGVPVLGAPVLWLGPAKRLCPVHSDHRRVSGRRCQGRRWQRPDGGPGLQRYHSGGQYRGQRLPNLPMALRGRHRLFGDLLVLRSLRRSFLLGRPRGSDTRHRAC